MQQRPLGRSGLAVSRLALGTMTWGRDTDADDAADQLSAYVAAGGNLVDTADVFGDGMAESILGTLLGPVVARDELLISTKAGLRPGAARRRDNSRGHLLRTLDASLRRLGTDHVDLWQVHGYDPQTPLEETLAALDHAVSSGRARYIGVANFAALADRTGRHLAGRRPGTGADRRHPDGVLAAGAGHRAGTAARLRRPGAGRAALVAAGRRGADRQVPPRPPGRLAGRRHRTWNRS